MSMIYIKGLTYVTHNTLSVGVSECQAIGDVEAEPVHVCGSGLTRQRVGADNLCPQLSSLQMHREHKVKGTIFLFPLDWLDIQLITGCGFNDSELQDQGKMIYYYYYSSFTMHFVNMKITIAEESSSVTRKAKLTPCHVYDSGHLTVRDNRPVTTHWSLMTESSISARLLVNWVAVVICCHIGSLDDRMWCLRGGSWAVSPPAGRNWNTAHPNKSNAYEWIMMILLVRCHFQ